jgi:hypothetical protein
MTTPFDVFESVNDGHLWIGTTKTLTEAVELIGKHPGSSGNSYLVFCQETRQQSCFKKEKNSVVIVPSG